MFLFFVAPIQAQVKEAERLRTDNNDLRGEKALFKVESHRKSNESLTLLMTGDDQYMVDFPEEKASKSSRVKVSNEVAKKVDGEFVKKFIHFKYVLKRKKSKNCRSVFTLFMRGEEQKVCDDEEAKISQLVGIVESLKNKLRLE
ncbi:MAG: hypothetical protein WEB87_02345 [Bacteriovoracaceae bacterium]